MCGESKLRKYKINKLEDMNTYDFELIVDIQTNFTMNDVVYNYQSEESVEHVFIVSISLFGFFLIMYNIINYLKLIN